MLVKLLHSLSLLPLSFTFVRYYSNACDVTCQLHNANDTFSSFFVEFESKLAHTRNDAFVRDPSIPAGMRDIMDLLQHWASKTKSPQKGENRHSIDITRTKCFVRHQTLNNSAAFCHPALQYFRLVFVLSHWIGRWSGRCCWDTRHK